MQAVRVRRADAAVGLVEDQGLACVVGVDGRGVGARRGDGAVRWEVEILAVRYVEDGRRVVGASRCLGPVVRSLRPVVGDSRCVGPVVRSMRRVRARTLPGCVAGQEAESQERRNGGVAHRRLLQSQGVQLVAGALAAIRTPSIPEAGAVRTRGRVAPDAAKGGRGTRADRPTRVAVNSGGGRQQLRLGWHPDLGDVVAGADKMAANREPVRPGAMPKGATSCVDFSGVLTSQTDAGGDLGKTKPKWLGPNKYEQVIDDRKADQPLPEGSWYGLWQKQGKKVDREYEPWGSARPKSGDLVILTLAVKTPWKIYKKVPHPDDPDKTVTQEEKITLYPGSLSHITMMKSVTPSSDDWEIWTCVGGGKESVGDTKYKPPAEETYWFDVKHGLIYKNTKPNGERPIMAGSRRVQGWVDIVKFAEGEKPQT